MKLNKIQVGAKILSPNLYVFIKLDEENVSFINDDGRWDTIKCEDDSDWQLITKCENCKHFESHIKFCNKIGMGIEIGDDESLDQDPDEFSCSLFEIKKV